MGDQINRIENKIDLILKAIYPEQKKTEQKTEKVIKQPPKTQE